MIKSTELEIKQYIRDMNKFLDEDEKEITSQNEEDHSEDEDVEASII